MKFYAIIPLLLCAALFASCCLRGRDDQTVLLPQAITDALPYADAEELRFLSNTGDTLKTRVNYKQENIAVSCAECYCESVKNENRSFTLVNDDLSALAVIVADASFQPGQIDFIVGDDYLELPLSASGTFLCSNTQTTNITCYDSLAIQNQIYKNVFELESAIPAATTLKIFYNTEKGVLRVEKKDGSFWDLL